MQNQVVAVPLTREQISLACWCLTELSDQIYRQSNILQVTSTEDPLQVMKTAEMLRHRSYQIRELAERFKQ